MKTITVNKETLLRAGHYLYRSSVPAWLMLGVLCAYFALFIPASGIQQFSQNCHQRMWLLTYPFYPAWFSVPLWCICCGLVVNTAVWLLNHYPNTRKKMRLLSFLPAPVPCFSFPFIAIVSFGMLCFFAHNSGFFQRLYAPRDSYIRDPAELKELLKNKTADARDVGLEKMAAAKPVRSKVRGRLWHVPDEVSNHFTEMSYHCTGGRYDNADIKYRLRIPQELKEGEKYPLLIWLHGVGESGNDNISQLSHMEPLIPFIMGPRQRDFFILASQCPKENNLWDRGQIDAENLPMVITMKILDDVIQKYPVDADAVSVLGFSSGGYGVWSMGQAFPGRFTVLIPIASNPPRDMYQSVIDNNTAVWAFNNSGDGQIIHTRIKDEIEKIHSKGGTAYTTTFDAKGHEAWRNAILETPLIDWILWCHKSSSPFRVPYNVQVPKTSRIQIFCIFVLPVFIGIGVSVVPLIVLRLEKKPRDCMIQSEQKRFGYEKKMAMDFRFWTNKEETKRVELKLLGFQKGQVKLIARNGQSVSIPIDRLSDFDTNILKAVIEEYRAKHRNS